MQQIIKIVLITFLIFGNTLQAEEKLTKQERESLNQIVEKFVNSLYKDSKKLQRLTKYVAIGLRSHKLNAEEIEKRNVLDKTVNRIAKITNIQFIGYGDIEKYKDKRKSLIIIDMSKDPLQKLKKDKWLQSHYFSEDSQSKISSLLEKTEKYNPSSQMYSWITNQENSDFENTCAALVKTTESIEKIEIGFTQFLFKCFFVNSNDVTFKNLYSIKDKQNEQYVKEIFSVIRQVLLNSLYRSNLDAYIGNELMFEKAKEKLIQRTVDELLFINYGKKVLEVIK